MGNTEMTGPNLAKKIQACLAKNPLLRHMVRVESLPQNRIIFLTRTGSMAFRIVNLPGGGYLLVEMAEPLPA